MLQARRLRSASSMCCSSRATIDSQEFLCASASPRSIRCDVGLTRALFACVDELLVLRARLQSTSLNCATTSSTGVETIESPCRHVFESFCWIDETRRLIHGERHQANIEPFRVARQLRVIAPAEPVQIRRAAERSSDRLSSTARPSLRCPSWNRPAHASSS